MSLPIGVQVGAAYGRGDLLLYVAASAGCVNACRHTRRGPILPWSPLVIGTLASLMHIVISKLRETLGPHTTEEIIHTVPGGYRLALEPDHVDAHLFTRLTKRARTARTQGGGAAADALFRTALQ
ncbi:hypothetical protein ACIBI9_06125 [Nonomuraea sp. NPDC050451]|uniref:hypothetical protein n=1 Tax=Nonomuraea sp. NPDC050451 TaxID=3364364 RepID=UPI00379FF29A